jgi:hypothetical protein
MNIRRRSIGVSLVVMSMCGFVPEAKASNQSAPPKVCGEFKAQGYVMTVSAEHLPCATAMAIQREYWLAPDSRRTYHDNGFVYNSYVTLKRYPGWKCSHGSGAGTCTKGTKVAWYENRLDE